MVKLHEWFYDNPCDPWEGSPEVVRVERVYCLAFNDFTEAHWNELENIYHQLPGERLDTDIACWYGADPDTFPGLCASVEPSGLLVAGVLLRQDWEQWDTALRTGVQAASLPIFAVE